MKIIKYDRCTKVNHGTRAVPVYEEVLSAVEMPWSEANEALAAQEAHGGIYTIEETDEVATPIAQDDWDAMLVDHEYRLTLLELGLTESEV